MSDNSGGKFLIAICLDRTGSMAAYRDQTVSGFNEFLHQQQADPNGEVWLSLTLFDRPGNENEIEERFVARPILEIPDLGTPANPYHPRGNTPLYDAIGVTVRACERLEGKYDRVLFVIQTDGDENSSRDWTRTAIFDLITAKRAQGWAFIFMGADQDAFSASVAMGVAAGSTMSYVSSHAEAAFAAASSGTSVYRSMRGATADSFFTTEPPPTSAPSGPGSATAKSKARRPRPGVSSRKPNPHTDDRSHQ